MNSYVIGNILPDKKWAGYERGKLQKGQTLKILIKNNFM